MPEARIYKPVKNAMQSGRDAGKGWLLEFEPNQASLPDNLMGWNGSSDTSRQIKIYFSTKEEAINYADRNQLSYTISVEKKRVIKPKSYASNFGFHRTTPWTH